jgi:hypothetical protein
MSVPIPLQQDFSAPQLRSLAKKTKDGPQARRLLTLAAIYDGASRTEAAKIGGVGLRSFGTGCYGSTHGAPMGCWTSSRQASPPSSMMASARR